MEEELRLRLSKELKAKIRKNAKESNMNVSSYARVIFNNVGVVSISRGKLNQPEISIIEKVIKKINA